MILTKIVRDEADTIDLLETYSNENYMLRQIETNKIYGSSVIDVIEGYDENNIPYSRYTYIETDIKDEETENFEE